MLRLSKPTVKGRQRRAGGALPRLQVLEQRVVLAHHRQPAQHVAVTAEILGATVDDEVDTEVAGSLADRCSEGVVADYQRSGPMGDGSDRFESVMLSSGLLGVSNPDHARPPADGIPHRC